MEKNDIRQEILLLTGTTFTSEELCKKDDFHQGEHLFENERLEEACWNGMLQTRLPEIFSPASIGGLLYIWQIREAGSFLVLDLGEVPENIDEHFSIVPYLFLSTLSYN